MRFREEVQMQVLGPMVTEMEILLETRDCGEKLMTRPEPPFWLW